MSAVCILPEASVDVSVQLESLRRGERAVVYFTNRTREEMPEDLASVEVRDADESGVAVFTNRENLNAYEADVQGMGVREANAKWLGYIDSTKENGVVVTATRNGGVVYDELVPDEHAVTRAVELEHRFPQATVTILAPETALSQRLGRYSVEDKTRFCSTVSSFFKEMI